MLKTKQKLHVGIFSAKHIQHKQVHTGCHTEYFVLGFTQQTELKMKDLRIVVALKMAKAPPSSYND